MKIKTTLKEILTRTKPKKNKSMNAVTPTALEESPLEFKPHTAYPGTFGQLHYGAKNQVGWHGCREVFAGVFTRKLETFLFSHTPNKGEAIAAFFAKIEDKLKLKKNRTKFLRTKHNNIIQVVPSDWWKKYLVRRYLFTILLRSGQHYNLETDNFDTALLKDKYAAETKSAVARFLDGYTFAKKSGTEGIGNGWRNRFSGMSKKTIANILIKPPKKKPVEVNDDPIVTNDKS